MRIPALPLDVEPLLGQLAENWVLLAGAGAVLLLGAGLLVTVQRKRRLRMGRGFDRSATARHQRITSASSNNMSGMSGDDWPHAYDDALQRGAYQEAALLARRRRDPRRYARALERAGDMDRAITAWIEAGESHRAAALLVDNEQWAKAGRLFQEMGEFHKALDCFQKAEDFMKAAQVMRELGQPKKAAEYEGDALARRGEHMEAARRYVAGGEMLKAAQQLIAAGDLPKAVEALRRAGRAGDAAKMLAAKGDMKSAALLFEEGSAWEEAARCWRKHGDVDREAAALAQAGKGFKAGRLAFERNELDAALTYLSQVSPLDERHPEANLLLGTIHERRGELAEAAKGYKLFLDSRTPSAKTKLLFLRVARIEEGIGHRRAALNLLGQVITAGLGTADVTAWAAQLEQALGDEIPTEELDQTMDRPKNQRMFGRTSAGLRGATRMGLAGRAGGRGRGTTDHGVRGQAPKKPSGLPADLTSHEDEPVAIRTLKRRYVFRGRVGQGGNGVVYRASDRALGREVVVKFLHQALLPTDVARKYFQREAKTAASLSHPNIVTIFDVGQEGETLYFSMEFVEGRTLADVIVDAGGHLDHRTALPLVTQLCAALDYAHERQVIHRDIKPGNIMVTDTGHLKLLDFGLAKALDENPDKSVFLCGTPFYMSPEQIRRDFLDHRTDVYSLGCLLYVIYCGDVPFPEGNIFYHHQHTAPPDPREIEPSVPENVARVLMKTISKDRDARYQRTSDVARELAAC